MRRHAALCTPTISIRRSRDPADDKFLECAVAGAVDYLVSADDDLLSLRAIEGIPIVDVPAFSHTLAARAPSEPSGPR